MTEEFQDAQDNQRPPATHRHVDDRCRIAFMNGHYAIWTSRNVGTVRNGILSANTELRSQTYQRSDARLQDAVDKYHNSFKLDYRRDDNSPCNSGIEGIHAHFNNKTLPNRENDSVAPAKVERNRESLCETCMHVVIRLHPSKHGCLLLR